MLPEPSNPPKEAMIAAIVGGAGLWKQGTVNDKEFVESVRHELRDTVLKAVAAGRVAGSPAASRESTPALPELPAAFEMDWPELHAQALGCGIEDCNIRDRYEAANYGWQDAINKCIERFPDGLYTADQMREYALAAIAAAGGAK